VNTPDELDAAVRQVAAVMAWALPGCDRSVVSIVDVDRFLAVVAHQRVSGLVLEAFDAGAVGDASDDLRSRLVDAHLDALRLSLAVEAASVHVADLLRAASIPFAVLKGCATAHLDYPDPAPRITGDVDLLIARDDLTVALAVLDRAGRRRVHPPFRSGWEQRYGKDIIVTGDDGMEIDLHLALVEGWFGIRMPTAPLLARRADYEVAGRTMPALDTLGRLLHACIHTASSTPVRLGSAADVVQIAGATRPDAVRAVADLPSFAGELGVAPLVARGVRRVWHAFGTRTTELSEWATSCPATADEEASLAAFDTTVGETRWKTGARALPPLRRPGYALPLVLPSRDHLRARNRSYLDHLRISARRLRARSLPGS
jgi:hypothetical protein